MARVSLVVLQAVEEALQRYEEEVEASRMTSQSKITYRDHARQFVRWLDDDFEPGANVKRMG